MQYLGDYAEDYATLNFKFHSRTLAQVPATLTDGVISIYKANGTTQSTAGITLTADFDSVTGLNNVLIDLSADAFYAIANDYQIVITAGTVDSVSVVGTVIAHFSIENRFNEVDVTKLGGAAQSLTDLKDFADTGYDPSTHKVQGVVLTDTLVTNSDKTGYSLTVTPPTASDIATAVWAAGTRTLSSFGSLVADIATAVWGAVARTITGGAVDTCTTNTDMRGTDSALLAANYTAPNNSGITGIKAKTDQLTFTEANKVDATATVSVAGLATEAKQDEIISDIAGVITHGDANWLTPSGIGGTISITLNVKDDSGNNILDAVVEVWDTAGTTLKERKETNSSGNAVFNCKAESYTIKITKSGYSFDNASYTVTVPATVNYVMTAFVIPVSPDLTKCRVWMKLINTYTSLTVTADVPENLTGNNLVMGNYTGVYDTVNNLVYWDLPIGALNSVLKITELGFEVVVPLILDLESSELKDLI